MKKRGYKLTKKIREEKSEPKVKRIPCDAARVIVLDPTKPAGRELTRLLQTVMHVVLTEYTCALAILYYENQRECVVRRKTKTG